MRIMVKSNDASHNSIFNLSDAVAPPNIHLIENVVELLCETTLCYQTPQLSVERPAIVWSNRSLSDRYALLPPTRLKLPNLPSPCFVQQTSFV